MGQEKVLKYFSMFSGVGGFEYGIQQADNNKSKIKRLQREGDSSSNNEQSLQRTTHCVGFSEIDKYSIQTYTKHFPKHKNWGDCTKINPADLPDFDMLCGGFPCQAFSIAGKRMGFEDTRGTLFFDIARIIKAKKPRLIFLENVKGLLSHDNGRTFATILTTLSELGYNAEWEVLNSKYFCVPQNRERVFIIGHIRGSSGRQIFPIGQSHKTINEENKGTRQEIMIIDDVARMNKGKQGDRMKNDGTCFTLNTIEQRGIMIEQLNNHMHSNDRVYGIEGLSPTLNTMGGGNRQPFIQSHRVNKIRRLTPIECERLQGFPDNWTEGVSDTQRYKQMGNAVTTNVITTIVEKMIEVQLI